MHDPLIILLLLLLLLIIIFFLLLLLSLNTTTLDLAELIPLIGLDITKDLTGQGETGY